MMKRLHRRMKTQVIFVVGVFVWTLGVTPASAQWLQFGGPNRNFIVETTGLADKWPDDGPKKLWHRELGDGYSSIIVDNNTLYTMYRESSTSEKEFTIALDARTGKTLWQHQTTAPLPEATEYATGPNSTPLVLGDYVYSVRTNQVLHCFKKDSGSVVWKRAFAEDFGSQLFTYGYGSSPLAYQGNIILPVGGRRSAGTTLIAYDAASGKVAWKSETIPHAENERDEYAAPIVIRFGGRDHLVHVSNEKILGFNPASGRLLWHHPHVTSGRTLSTPAWNGKDTIFCSTAYDSGSRVIRLNRKQDQAVPQELWFHKKMSLWYGNALILGDMVVGSSGSSGPAFLMGADLETGKILWQERGFKRAYMLYADGKLILLGEDGELGLATATRAGVTILSRASVAQLRAWTPPTLVGTTVYVRDRKHIMAIDIGRH